MDKMVESNSNVLLETKIIALDIIGYELQKLLIGHSLQQMDKLWEQRKDLNMGFH